MHCVGIGFTYHSTIPTYKYSRTKNIVGDDYHNLNKPIANIQNGEDKELSARFAMASSSASGGPTKAMIYELYPLNTSKSEIRVLEILSAAGSSPQSYEICLRFHVVSLLEEPEYCALSYVWGDPDTRLEITVQAPDGIEVKVSITENLGKALRHIEHHYLQHLSLTWDNNFQEGPKEDSEAVENSEAVEESQAVEKQLALESMLPRFRIWADALCINQDDLKEKSSQVHMMRDIYRSAHLVFGSIEAAPQFEYTDKAIQQAFEGVLLLSESIGELETKEDVYNLDWIMKHEVFQQTSMDQIGPESSVWRSIMAFPEHPYFTRVWIWQEICLAREFTFIHGVESLNYTKVRAVQHCLDYLRMEIEVGKLTYVSAMQHSGVKQVLDGETRFVHRHVNSMVLANLRLTKQSCFAMLRDIRQEILHQDGGLDTRLKFGLSHKASNLQATNPKDFVYGLLGLTEHAITVEYDDRIPLGQVFAADASLFLTAWQTLPSMSHELLFLDIAGSYLVPPSDSMKELVPSWVPAYHLWNNRRSVPRIRQSLGLKSLESSPGAEISLENQELRVSGTRVGRVRLVMSGPLNKTSQILRGTLLFSDLLIRAKHGGHFPVVSSKPMRTLFQAATLQNVWEDNPQFLRRSLAWLSYLTLDSDLIVRDNRVMLSDLDGSLWKYFGFPTGEDFVQWYGANFSSLSTNIKALEEILSTRDPTDGPLGKFFFRIHIPREDALALDHDIGNTYPARMIFLTDNGLIGSGPYSMQEGDDVVVFKGAEAPNILRRTQVSNGDSKYENIGPSFLPELMNEKVEGLQEMERFVLI